MKRYRKESPQLLERHCDCVADDTVQLSEPADQPFAFLRSKYRTPFPLRYGTFGIVCASHRADSEKPISIKKIANCISNPSVTKQTIRALKLLKFFDHENVSKAVPFG